MPEQIALLSSKKGVAEGVSACLRLKVSVSLHSKHVPHNSGDLTPEFATYKAQLMDYGLGWDSQACLVLLFFRLVN